MNKVDNNFMQQEGTNQTMLNVAYCASLCTLWLKWERLRRWFISVEDRRQRLTLGSLGRVYRAEVHHRVEIGCYEGMAWDHLFMH